MLWTAGWRRTCGHLCPIVVGSSAVTPNHRPPRPLSESWSPLAADGSDVKAMTHRVRLHAPEVGGMGAGSDGTMNKGTGIDI